MPSKREEKANEWLALARSDLALARVEKPKEARWEALCFHAQQAAEKALKGVHVHHGLDYAWTHDIAELITCLRNRRIDVPVDLDDCADLTYYAVFGRYPNMGPQTTESEWREAVELAERAVRRTAPIIES